VSRTRSNVTYVGHIRYRQEVHADYHAAQQTVSITFRADAGIALAEELARSTQES
jgi:hypothetical protein